MNTIEKLTEDERLCDDHKLTVELAKDLKSFFNEWLAKKNISIFGSDKATMLMFANLIVIADVKDYE